MKRALTVAAREFWTTVSTKAFVFALLVVPAVSLLMALLLPRLVDQAPSELAGEVAVLDQSGAAGALVVEELRARASAERLPALQATLLPPGAPLEREKRALTLGPRLALVVIDALAVEPGPDGRYGSYQLFVRTRVDDRAERLVQQATEHAIVAVRARKLGLDLRTVERLTHVERAHGRTVTEAGEHASGAVFHALLPMGFMLLLMLSVLMTGQYLMTSTIEEKSSRVIEVLLSAVSPLELMAGKILGFLGVGLLVLFLYGVVGVVALQRAGLLALLEPLLLLVLLLSFLIAYFTVASLMAAIGASVSELRDAQTLLAPVMVVLILPWMLTMPISRDPSAGFAVVLSFLPPFSSFVMLIRAASASPPPPWQIALSLALGAACAWGAVWFAAKVFRIGLLLHGKPPDLRTLWRWARQG